MVGLREGCGHAGDYGLGGGKSVGDEPLDRLLLLEQSHAMGLDLDQAQLELFARFAAEMIAWNERVNLTRITDPSAIARLHFADALVCLGGLPDARMRNAAVTCVDIGSGAGVPGLALKIACPRWRLTLIESVAKKTAFLEHVISALGLDGLRVVTERAEIVGRTPEHREAYDVAVARAVADLSVLAEYALPLVRVGGRLLALKGGDALEESEHASGAFVALGGSLFCVDPYDLGGGAGRRHLVVVDKVEATPDRYPRRPGTPAKRPLR